MKNGQKQLNWSQGNETRLVTKCRYIIEVINRIFKQQFKALKETQNSMLSHIFDDFRIAASLINGFFSERISDKEDLTSSQNLYTKIKELQADGFPKPDVETLRKKITFGCYQLEQALRYLFEHFSANEGYEFLVSNNLENDEDSKQVFA
ncbi:unnamed protein product [Brachionus calyciflorus]|uniref:Uncharacterized protein n=1 Tax=Brachionus calyciflorus TaxID=104777 RepID=A0A814QVD6_9BILA|nr:unnamed protein product [Brachionus calyciflorus]